MKGYLKVLNTVYSQKYYYKRVKTFLKNYNFNNKVRMKLQYRDIKAFFRSMWRIGMIEKGKIYYWLLMLWLLKDPRKLPLAVRLSIYGFHFRKMLKTIQNREDEFAPAPANEYNPPDNSRFAPAPVNEYNPADNSRELLSGKSVAPQRQRSSHSI